MEKKIRELQDECEAGRASAAAAARVYQDKKEAWGAEIDYLKDQSLQLQRKLDQQQQQQQQRPPENNDVSKEVLLALQDATTALAATRRNLAASALQVASLKAELKQEKRLRRRAQGLRRRGGRPSCSARPNATRAARLLDGAIAHGPPRPRRRHLPR